MVDRDLMEQRDDRNTVVMLNILEQTSMDEMIKSLEDGIGVPADYCGSEAKSYVIGYRKALFDIGENWKKEGNK